MNRIILIGNGFDLAHGLETSYKHFIDWLWEREFNKIGRLEYIGAGKYSCENDFFSISAKSDVNVNKECPNYSFIKFKEYINFPDRSSRLNCRITFKNYFLNRLLNNFSLQNWVDIEEEYYTALKSCMKGEYEGGITKLNQDLKKIKEALILYLNKINDKLSNYTMDFPDKEIIENIYSNSEQIKNILFLNFNYTSTHKFYSGESNIKHKYEKLIKDKNVSSIQIHGSLYDIKNNPIIFGYGDEVDDEYMKIEKMNNNHYFENIKTMNYSKTNQYEDLRRYINSDKYQIFLLGHSCGLSDRTLLSMLFEHENCISIRPFYWIKPDDTNNYSDVYINISRHFISDKKICRERVMSEESCKPLTLTNYGG